MFIHPFSSHSSTTSLQLGIQGGQWDAELHAAVAPKCEHTFRATLYETPIRTAFASYPRSGNSYMRSLVERATGFQTGSRCEFLAGFPAGASEVLTPFGPC